MRLFEYTATGSRTPLDGPDAERERQERQQDAQLSADIAQAKRQASERSIKLTVVLLASRKMLDDASLDSRLTFIRRQSGLDSRAALFVLSPVSPAELAEFIKSLQQALHEPALEYYLAHSKRVRRKRNRHSQYTYSNPVASPAGTPGARPLRPEGWTVRYEYKMACFAEFRGEDEVALKHFQDSYSTLVLMFGSTAILPPRTKRWAEAKVLADCINIKICKLYLYHNEHSLALSQHSGHMKKFSDFSRGWGIGEETFEYWSWMARQHRVLAELLEHGLGSSLTLPSHAPHPQPSNNQSQSQPGGARPVDVEATRGLNPSNALQHPGFYYYMAARCTEARRDRFLQALEYEERLASTMPGFSNEKKVDHLTIILELFTKAYELFKAHSSSSSSGQGRLTLSIAYRIAQTYHEAGKYDMAVRFFERIAKTYRREKWKLILRPMLSTWYACAQQLGDVELSVKLLVEMICHGQLGDEEGLLQDDLSAILESTVPSSDAPLVVDITEAPCMLNSNVVFWRSAVEVGHPAPFQLSVSVPAKVHIASLPIDSLTIRFASDTLPPINVRHRKSTEGVPQVQIVDLGHLTSGKDAASQAVVEADLRWESGKMIVFTGCVSSGVSMSCNISRLVLNLIKNSWNIQIPFEVNRSLPSQWLHDPQRLKFTRIRRPDSHLLKFINRPHSMEVSFVHAQPAYIDEEYPVEIRVRNTDDRDLCVAVDVLLQPIEAEHAANSISMDEQRSYSLIKGVSFGQIKSGESVSKTLLLASAGAVGDRVLDVSTQSRSADERTESEENTDESDITEVLETLVVPVVAAFTTSSELTYRASLAPITPLVDLASFEPDYWHGGGECIINTRIECVGPWRMLVESINLADKPNEHARLLSYSAQSTSDSLPQELAPGDVLGDLCRIILAEHVGFAVQPQEIPSPGVYEMKWSRMGADGSHGPSVTSRIQLPAIRYPSQSVVALLDTPPVAKLHVPITVSLRIRNGPTAPSANVFVQVDTDPSDGFIIAGPRSGRLPILLPGAEEVVTWKMIPLECGHVQLPRMRVVDRRKPGPSAGGSELHLPLEDKIIPIKDGREDLAGGGPPSADADKSLPAPFTILVLPPAPVHK